MEQEMNKHTKTTKSALRKYIYVNLCLFNCMSDYNSSDRFASHFDRELG